MHKIVPNDRQIFLGDNDLIVSKTDQKGKIIYGKVSSSKFQAIQNKS